MSDKFVGINMCGGCAGGVADETGWELRNIMATGDGEDDEAVKAATALLTADGLSSDRFELLSLEAKKGEER